jgi:hypothetical protein
MSIEWTTGNELIKLSILLASITIKNLPARRLAVLEHRGDPKKVGGWCFDKRLTLKYLSSRYQEF